MLYTQRNRHRLKSHTNSLVSSTRATPVVAPAVVPVLDAPVTADAVAIELVVVPSAER